MKKGFQLRHVLDQKTPVLSNGVATHRRAVSRNVLFQKRNQLFLRLHLSDRGCLDLGYQTALTVRAFVPRIHLVELCITLMDNQDGALDAALQFGASHDDGDFNDALSLGIQTGHLAIEPDKIFIRFTKYVGVGCGHAFDCRL